MLHQNTTVCFSFLLQDTELAALFAIKAVISLSPSAAK